MNRLKWKTIIYLTIFSIGMIIIYMLASHLSTMLNDNCFEDEALYIRIAICTTYIQFPLAIIWIIMVVKKIPYISDVYAQKGYLSFTGIFYGTFAVVMISLAYGLIVYLTLGDVDSQPMQEAIVHIPMTVKIMYLIASCVMVPIMEEITFRAVIFSGFKILIGTIPAAIISNTIFALLHFNLYSFLFMLIFGFICTFLYIVYESVWAPIIVHGIYNLYSYSTAFSDLANVDSAKPSNEVVVILSIFYLLIAVVAIYRIKVHKDRRDITMCNEED